MTGINVTAGGMLVLGCLAAFFVAVFTMPSFIRIIRRLGMGKRIRVDGPQSHYSKEGTPTMGGLLIILVVIGVSLVIQLVRGRFIDPGTFAPLATLALVGALGTADDWLNARTGDGIRARHKMIWQTVVALVVAWQIQDTYDVKNIAVPFVGPIGIDPWLYILFGGLRHRGHQQRGEHHRRARRPLGWPAGVRVRRLHGHRRAQYLAGPAEPGHPVRHHHRRDSSGSCGSTSTPRKCSSVIRVPWGWGRHSRSTALITGQVMLLPVIGLVFVLETVQDIAQILWFKWKGRRLFRMAPLHHHFELSAGRREDHPPLLDRRRSVGAHRRGVLPGYAGTLR